MAAASSDSDTTFGSPHRHRRRSERSDFGYSDIDSFCPSYQNDTEAESYDIITHHNNVEIQRLINNRKFGFRKWKSHVTRRPLSSRSAVVRSLYVTTYQPVYSSVWTVGNVAYVVLYGWWIALAYLVVAALMYASHVSKRYGDFCLMMAKYFIWPFCKYIQSANQTYVRPLIEAGSNVEVTSHHLEPDAISVSLSHNDETEPIIRPHDVIRSYSLSQSFDESSSNGEIATETGASESIATGRTRMNDTDRFRFMRCCTLDFKSPEAVVWLIFGFPVLVFTHAVAWLFCWLPVIFIPAAKMNSRTLLSFLLLPPGSIRVEDSVLDAEEHTSDTLLYVHQAVNLFYYKYTVDGMNVILLNLHIIVVLAILIGYGDPRHSFAHQETKFMLALLSIVPLAYTIGLAISSVSAQTIPAIGALLNASFGSIVELILYLCSLVKERQRGTVCYSYLVKASLVGTLLATTLLIPGVAMVVGGLRHTTQRFNARSTAVSATLLFVSVAAVFAPSIFSSAYRGLHCAQCVNATPSSDQNQTWVLDCKLCYKQDLEDFAKSDVYKDSVEPMAYACVLVLVLAYAIGLLFSLKTHKVHVHDSFVPDLIEGPGGHHGEGSAQWGRAKSIGVLLAGTLVMCLCADLVVDNIEPIIKSSNVNVNFLGVSMLALAPDVPELVIGIQFALQNSVTMSIDMGCNIATQVCMLQIPILVLANLIYPAGFHMLFSETHIWSVAMAVFMMNYTLQDGKSNYFQGSALVIAYIAFMCMYFFTPDPPALRC